MMQWTVVDKWGLSSESHLVWTVDCHCTASPAVFRLHSSVSDVSLFSCTISQAESSGLFLLHNKDFRNRRKRKKAEKHSVSHFQYYMITLRFPLFQCDQCVCVTPPASCRWLKNLIRQKLWQLEWIIQRSWEQRQKGSVVPLCSPTLPLPLRG